MQPNREGDLSSMMFINIEKKGYQKTFDVFIDAKNKLLIWVLVGKKLHNREVINKNFTFFFFST